MRVKNFKKWGIPVGWHIYLSHKEACTLTNSKIEKVGAAFAAKIPFAGPLVAASLVLQNRVARRKNENSGGKGIRLRYIWAVGVITQIRARGRGESPC